MKSQLSIKFEDIISLENLFAAWQEFVVGKRKKKDVQEFSRHLIDNLTKLHEELANQAYEHGGYIAFNISDPKPRHIHKASVRDRVLHHAIYRKLYPFFDRTFIADSFSCRLNRGVHKALNRFREFNLKVSKNNMRTVWVLKCDIKKFFASIDHEILLGILRAYIPDQDTMWLLEKVIKSFSVRPPPLSLPSSSLSDFGVEDRRGEGSKVGLPLGNLTSQLFCNIYMNEFDQFVKHKIKSKYYIRYADDFIFFSESKNWLAGLISRISKFLSQTLKLQLHPNKIFLKTVASGVDFLGWANFPRHRVLRTATKRRMFKRIKIQPTNETLQSYLGLISHGNTFKIKEDMLNWHGLLRG